MIYDSCGVHLDAKQSFDMTGTILPFVAVYTCLLAIIALQEVSTRNLQVIKSCETRRLADILASGSQSAKILLKMCTKFFKIL